MSKRDIGRELRAIKDPHLREVARDMTLQESLDRFAEVNRAEGEQVARRGERDRLVFAVVVSATLAFVVGYLIGST